MNHIRQEKILTFIEQNHIVTIKQLMELCPDVSLMTIHRDLQALEERGMAVKIRGGARSVRHAGDPGFEERIQENNPAKTAIAQKALSLIQPHTSVFLDASTTNLILARSLPDINLNIFTTGPSIALELCRLHNPVITLCCGTVNRKNLALSGQNTLEMLEKINIDLAFIGVSGCSVEAGFTCGTESDMLVKHKVIQKARTSVALCDRVKLSRLMPYTFAQLEDVDYLISDAPLPDPFVEAANRAGIRLL
ncbi:MAG: DeoR/GlpR transcriptional regulator [Oscillospiraceae bacterium]|nr:DeoR/GlpR transcriptional regulator [Oscillospiraceae bacterium]